MEERIKLLEAQITVINATLQKMDPILGALAQWLIANKTFMDGLQVQKPSEVVKPEEKK